MNLHNSVRRIAMLTVCALVFLCGLQHASAQQNDSEKVRARLVSFLERATALSAAAPPPGLNAANGYFINGVHGTDVQLANLATAPIGTTTPEGEILEGYYFGFTHHVRVAFEAGTHSASFPNAQVIWDTFWHSRDQIVNTLQGGGGLSAVKVKAEVDRIAQSLEGKVVTSGAHGNGYTSVNLRDNCNVYQKKLHNTGISSDAGIKALTGMRVACQGWAALPTEGHAPWLQAVWQVGFQAVATETAALLKQ